MQERQERQERLRAMAAQRGGVFTRQDALRFGLSVDMIRHALKSGRWRALHQGVYVESGVLDSTIGAARHALLLAAVIACLPRRAVASHESALLLRDVALYEDPRLLSLTSDTGAYRRTADFRVCVAALPVAHVARGLVHGIPSSTLSRALVDVSRTGDLRSALIPLEDALHRGLVTKAELMAVLAACCEWPGAAMAREFVEFAEPKAESPAESLSRCMFREQGIEMPEAQVWIAVDSDVPQYRVDFHWERWRVIGEVDGKGKYLDPMARWEEKRREEHLGDADYEVVRWSYGDAKDRGPAVKAKILRAFARAARRFGLPG
jgi:hypothetical protein